MSVIQKDTDRATKKEVAFAEGTIKKVFCREKPKPLVMTPKSGPNAGKTVTLTHERKLLLVSDDGSEAWIDFGAYSVKPGQEKYALQFQIKHEDKFLELAPGIKLTIYPLKDESWTNSEGKLVEKWGGKVSCINILDASGARPNENFNPDRPQQPQGNKPAGNAGGKGGTKVFGEIISIENGVAQVKTEDGLVGPVVLGSNEASVTVGGRLTAMVDNTGNILSGFKAYGPAGSNGGGTKGGKSFSKDNSGMETGHAINGALNMVRNGFGAGPVVLAKLVHDVTIELKASEAKEERNKGLSDYDIGASTGHAVLNATRDIQYDGGKTLEQVAEDLKAMALDLLTNVVPDVLAYVKEKGPKAGAPVETPQGQKKDIQKPTRKEPEPKPEPEPPSYDADTLDFDDDIPF